MLNTYEQKFHAFQLLWDSSTWPQKHVYVPCFHAVDPSSYFHALTVSTTLVLSSHILPDFPCGVFFFGFPTKILCALVLSFRARQLIFPFFFVITIIFREEYELWNSECSSVKAGVWASNPSKLTGTIAFLSQFLYFWEVTREGSIVPRSIANVPRI